MSTRITTIMLSTMLVLPAVAQDNPPALPAADDLINRAIEAAGGRDALQAIQTVSFDAEMLIQDEANGLIDAVVSPDGRGHYRGSAMQGQVTFEFGFDDTIGWAREGGNEWRLQSGKELLIVHVWVANQFLILRLDEWFETRETIERAPFRGKDAYRVRLKDDDGKMLPADESLFAWFDSKTGVLIGIADEAEMSAGIAFEEFKKTGSLNMAHSVPIEIAGYMMLRISNVQIDRADEGRLEPPAEVRKLIDAMDDQKDGAPLHDRSN